MRVTEAPPQRVCGFSANTLQRTTSFMALPGLLAELGVPLAAVDCTTGTASGAPLRGWLERMPQRRLGPDRWAALHHEGISRGAEGGGSRPGPDAERGAGDPAFLSGAR